MHKKVFLFLTLILLSSTACSQQSDTITKSYKAEAQALCDAFNPETWNVDIKTLNPTQLADMLSKKITSAIHSDKMEKYFQTLSHDRTQSAYPNFTKGVSGLIGEPYKCDAMKDYFSVSFK